MNQVVSEDKFNNNPSISLIIFSWKTHGLLRVFFLGRKVDYDCKP